jgi:Primase C terminal 2 (PriCT-2)
VPCQSADPMRHASTQDAATWDSFPAAMGAVAAAEADGAGYVLSGDAEHVFLDLDNCRDPVTGEIAPWAMRLLEECGSYAEVTPSGRGLRIIGLNESFRTPVHRSVAMPDGSRVEIYHRCPRYVTVSGQRLPGAPDELRPICDVAADLLPLARPEGQGKPDAPSPAPRSNPDAAANPEDIASALAQIPNPDLPWEEWSRVGMAVWRASGGSEAGFDAWRKWSAKSRKHADIACGERWAHWFRSPPDRIGFASLHHLARLANPLWVKPSLMQGLHGAPAAATQSAPGGGGDDWEGEVPNAAPQAASAAPAPLTATPFDPAELATLRPREWVYGHFLISRFVSVLGSPPLCQSRCRVFRTAE